MDKQYLKTRSNVGAMAALNAAAATSIPPPDKKKITKRKVGKQTKEQTTEITVEELDALNVDAHDLISADDSIAHRRDDQIKTFFDQHDFETILQNMRINIPLDWLDSPVQDRTQNEALGYYLNKGHRFQSVVTERILIHMELDEAEQILFNSRSGEAEVVTLTPTQKTFIGSAIAFYRYYKNVSNGIIIDPIITGQLLSFLQILYETLSMFQASKELDDELQQSAKERNTGGYELVRYVDPKAIFSIQTQSGEIQSVDVAQPFTRNFEDTGLGRQINSFYDENIYVDSIKPFNMIKSNIIINTALALALNKYLLFKTPGETYDYENSIKVFMGIGYRNDANWNNFDLDRVYLEATGRNIDELLTQQDIPDSLIFDSENSGIIVDNISPLASSSYDYWVALKFVKRPNIIYGVVISIIYGPNMKYFIASNSANEKEEIVLPCKLQLSKIFIDTTNMVVVFELRIIQELTTVVLKSKWESVINKELLQHIQKMYKGKKKGKKEVLSSQPYGSQDTNFFSPSLVSNFESKINPDEDPYKVDAGGSKSNRKSKNKTNKSRNQNKRKTNKKRRTNKRRTNKRRRI
jgi:hypothetical protein